MSLILSTSLGRNFGNFTATTLNGRFNIGRSIRAAVAVADESIVELLLAPSSWQSRRRCFLSGWYLIEKMSHVASTTNESSLKKKRCSNPTNGPNGPYWSKHFQIILIRLSGFETVLFDLVRFSYKKKN